MSFMSKKYDNYVIECSDAKNHVNTKYYIVSHSNKTHVFYRNFNQNYCKLHLIRKFMFNCFYYKNKNIPEAIKIQGSLQEIIK